MKRSRILLSLTFLALLVSCNPNISSEKMVSERTTTSEVVSEISGDSLGESITSSEKSKELTTVFFQNPVYNVDFPDPNYSVIHNFFIMRRGKS